MVIVSDAFIYDIKVILTAGLGTMLTFFIYHLQFQYDDESFLILSIIVHNCVSYINSANQLILEILES